MANKKNNQEKMRIEKEKRFKALCKNLVWFPAAATCGLAVVLLLFFCPWANIVEPNGLNIAFNGWHCIIATLTGDFTGISIADGFLAVPFYHYAEDSVTIICLFTLITLILIIINIVLQIVALVNKKHILNAASIPFDILTAIILIVCFAVSVAMSSPVMTDYGCSPECYFLSLAIIPAILSLGIAAVHIVCTVKFFSAKSLLV